MINNMYKVNEELKNTKLMIPTPLGEVKKEKFSNKQVVIGILSLTCSIIILIIILLSLWDYSRDSIIANIVMKLMCIGVLYLEFKVIWNHFFRMPEVLKDFIKFRDNQVVDISSFYDIRPVSKDGRLIYRNGIEAYVIRLGRGSSKGVPDDYQIVSDSLLTDMFTELFSKGYSVNYYSNNSGEPNLIPLNNLNTNLSKIRGSKIYDNTIRIVNNMRNQVKDIPMEIEYLLVYSSGSYLNASRLGSDVEQFVEMLGGSLYEKSYVLNNSSEVLDFCRRCPGLLFMDNKKLNENFSKKNKLNVFKLEKEELPPQIVEDYDEFNMNTGTDRYEEILKNLNS